MEVKNMDSFFDTNNMERSYFRMAFPVVLGMVVTLIYNLADTFLLHRPMTRISLREFLCARLCLLL